jgi:hypothetical protein
VFENLYLHKKGLALRTGLTITVLAGLLRETANRGVSLGRRTACGSPNRWQHIAIGIPFGPKTALRLTLALIRSTVPQNWEWGAQSCVLGKDQIPNHNNIRIAVRRRD